MYADSHAGYHGDELMHIDAGRHLAFGYADFPPVIGVLAFLQNLYGSDALHVNHFFVYLASSLILVFCTLITWKLGGGRLSVILTLTCIVFSPGLALMHSLFLPNVFEQLAWVGCFYLLVSYCNDPKNRYLVLFGIVAGMGFLTKYSVVFLLAGSVLSILCVQRSLLTKKYVWISLLIFLVVISPNLIWQINHDFPMTRHFSALYDSQLDQVSFVDEMTILVLFLNPVIAPLWIGALLVIHFVPRFKKYRILSFTLLFAFLLFFISKGKFYYYMSLTLGLVSLASVYLEHLLINRKWIFISYLSTICLAGLYLLPQGLPIMKLSSFIEMYKLEKNEDGNIPLAFEQFYSASIWEQIISVVDSTYQQLPGPEQDRCLTWGRHMSIAGGINLMGKSRDLPLAISFHGSYYDWVPKFSTDKIVIAIGEDNWKEKTWEQYFEEVEEVAVIKNLYASRPSWYSYRIFLCRKLKYDSEELKNLLKHEVYGKVEYNKN